VSTLPRVGCTRSPNPRGGRQRDEAIREDLARIVAEIQPCTVRQAYYQATVQGVIRKTDAGYRRVVELLVELRIAGAIPWGQLVDNTRYMRKPVSHHSLLDAADRWARTYRRDLLTARDQNVEVWLEKDALSGVIEPVTVEYDVPLMCCRGYPSLTYVHDAAERIAAHAEVGNATTVYYLGDHDPSGRDIDRNLEARLRQFAPEVELSFARIAVTAEQILAWSLPSRPTKTTDSRARGFDGDSVELDAIHPADLRDLVRRHVLRHVDQDELERLREIEEAERSSLREFAATFRGRSGG
jgi:hypothetical protein